MTKKICVKFDENMSDPTILRKCADVLNHISRKYQAEVRVRDFKFDRDICNVTMEIEAVKGYIPSYDEVKKDMDRIFNQMFGDVFGDVVGR